MTLEQQNETEPLSKREARRKRNREDQIRITQMKVPSEHRDKVGQTWGRTFREKLEDEITNHVKRMRKQKAEGNIDLAKQTRITIRGLAKALALYERFHSLDSDVTFKTIEEDFLGRAS